MIPIFFITKVSEFIVALMTTSLLSTVLKNSMETTLESSHLFIVDKHKPL